MALYPFFRTIFYLGIICLLLASCSRFEESQKEKIRKQHEVTEEIIETNRSFYSLAVPNHAPRSSYPWEAEGHLPRITKEFFRCKGNSANPTVTYLTEQLLDCGGTSRHGLPIIQGKEGVYPLIIDLLNYIQKKTSRRVIITCGHRCPIHNKYADPTKENQTSKHQIGAEVDFYVQGMEDRPLEIVGLAMQYFRETPPYSQDKDAYEFKPYEKGDGKTRIKPWMSKDLFIKIYSPEEGRDGDNRHPYSYICFQVRFDRQNKQPVVYSWERANQGYPRS